MRSSSRALRRWVVLIGLLGSGLPAARARAQPQPPGPPGAFPPIAASPEHAPAEPLHGKAAPEAVPLRAKATLDKPQVAVGEPFTLTIEVAHAPSETYSLPQPLAPALGDLSLRGEPQISRRVDAKSGEAVTTFALPLVDLKTLEPLVPELKLRVDGPGGTRAYTLPKKHVSLRSLVEPQGEKTKEKGPRPPKKPVQIYVRSYLWVGALLGLAALGGLLYAAAVLGRRHREKRALADQPVPLTADEEALQRIHALKQRAPWQQGRGRAAIFELSEIVRTYLGKRLQFDAIDLTTDELLAELRRRRILGLDLAELTEQLSWEALVKFAKVEPTAQECEDACVRAAELVERIAHALMAEFNRGNLRAQVLGDKDRMAVQIATRAGAMSGGQTALTINLQTVEDGVMVELGQQAWLGVAASLGQTAISALRNPFSLLGRLDDLAQDIESIQLNERTWKVIDGVVAALKASYALSEKLSRIACAYCGSANPLGEANCLSCGAPLGDAHPTTCQNCGFVVTLAEAVCPNCGAKLQ